MHSHNGVSVEMVSQCEGGKGDSEGWLFTLLRMC